jgi:hypothetical protein
MNNSMIVFERIDIATLTASAGSDADYPLTNLQDGRYATQWKADAETQDQTLEIEHAIARVTNSILIANHNLNSLGLTSLEIKGWHGGVIKTITSFPEMIYEEWDDDDATDTNLLTFKKASALSAAPMIGMIFIGRKVELPLYLNNPKRGLKSTLVRDESLSGLPFRAATHPERQTWKLAYGALKQSEIAEVFRWLRGIGMGLHPFWLRDMDDNWHFVGYDADAAESGAKGDVIFDLQNVQLSEERVGITMALPGSYTA